MGRTVSDFGPSEVVVVGAGLGVDEEAGGGTVAGANNGGLGTLGRTLRGREVWVGIPSSGVFGGGIVNLKDVGKCRVQCCRNDVVSELPQTKSRHLTGRSRVMRRQDGCQEAVRGEGIQTILVIYQT